MAAPAAHSRRPPGPPAGPPTGQPPAHAPRDGAQDAWPFTTRVLPWALFGFLVMLWLVPFDSAQAALGFPVDLKLDRLYIAVLAVVWAVSTFAGGQAAPRWRHSPIDIALVAFVAIAIASVALDATVLAREGDLDEGVKKLSLLGSYAAFFFIAASTLRSEEVARFAKALLALAVIMAVGVIYQKSSGRNVFFDLAQSYLPGGFTLKPAWMTPDDFSVPPVTGPTQHPLAIATMLAMALPFAVVGFLQSPVRARRIGYLVVAGVLLWATLATSRKTGNNAMLVALLTLWVLRPRQMVRLLPVGALLLVVAIVVNPHAVAVQVDKIRPSTALQGRSSEARKADYPAIVPDVRNRPVIGRGYGTFDGPQHRILDNQYLALLVETGLLGVAAFLLVVAAVPAAARRGLRSRIPSLEGPALAVTAAAMAFAVAGVFFSVLAYAQVPYAFLFIGALAVACRPSNAPAASAPPPPARRLARPAVARRRARGHAGSRVRPPRRPGQAAGGGRWRPLPAPAGALAFSRLGGPPRMRHGVAALASLLLVALVLSERGGPTPPALADVRGTTDPFTGLPVASSPRPEPDVPPPTAPVDRGPVILAQTDTSATTSPSGDAPPAPRRPIRPAPPAARRPTPSPPAPPTGVPEPDGSVVGADTNPPPDAGPSPDSTEECLPGELDEAVEEALKAAGVDPCDLPRSPEGDLEVAPPVLRLVGRAVEEGRADVRGYRLLLACVGIGRPVGSKPSAAAVSEAADAALPAPKQMSAPGNVG